MLKVSSSMTLVRFGQYLPTLTRSSSYEVFLAALNRNSLLRKTSVTLLKANLYVHLRAGGQFFLQKRFKKLGNFGSYFLGNF